MNDVQTSQRGELDLANLFLEGILSSLGVGVVVIDREERVRVWNPTSEELWGLRAGEVEGEHLMSLEVGFPAAQLQATLQRVLAEGNRQELTVEVVTRRGRSMSCRVRMQPLRKTDGEVYGAVLLMEVTPPSAE